VIPDRLEHIQALYNDALVLAPGDRAAFLDRACGGDSELRNEVESLLEYQQRAENYMERAAIHVAAQALADEGAGVLVDRMLGRYQLLSLLGRGGMAEVYCAVDSKLNRLVAVKILPTYMASDDEHVKRFEQEARSIAVLNHPHICVLHDAGYEDGLHYLVFEFLAGEPLSERLSREELPLNKAMEYAAQIAGALDYAHELGVIHLDLKPSNIMLMKSGAKLLDFGVAELRYPDTPASSEAPQPKDDLPGGIPGTLGYMAPEQLEGGRPDARTDIFAFGAVLYEMLTRRPAFPLRTAPAWASDDNPPPVSETRREVPPAVDSLIARCLTRKASDRWPSMSEVLSLCREIQAALPTD
jgi:serine/threonine protein kinase